MPGKFGIVDDRGVIVQRNGTATRLHRVLPRKERWLRRVAMCGPFGACAVIVLAIAGGIPYWGMASDSFTSAILAALMFATLVTVLAFPAMVLLLGYLWICRWRALFRRNSTCLVCFYPLAGGAPEADGCTVCPECGAAWRLPEGAEPRSHEGREG